MRDRQIAEEQVETYARQEKASFKERELREVEARARQQQLLTESEVGINIQANQGKADYQRSLQQAAQIRALADAEAEKVARIGIAQAMAIEEQVRAYGGPRYQVVQQVMNRFSEAVEKSKIDVVPRVIVSGAGKDGVQGQAGSNALESLLTVLLAERMAESGNANAAPRSEEVESLRAQIREGLKGHKEATDNKGQ